MAENPTPQPQQETVYGDHTDGLVPKFIATAMPNASRFVDEAWRNSSVGAKVNLVKNIPRMILTPSTEPGGNPINDMATELYHQHIKQFSQAGENARAAVSTMKDSGVPLSQRVSAANADLLEAGGHAAAGVLPLVGPAAAESGEKIGSGDVAGGSGSALGLIMSTLLGGRVSQSVLDKVLGKGAGAAEAEAEAAAEKAAAAEKTVKPTGTQVTPGQHIDNPWDSRNPINQVKKLSKEASSPTAEESAKVQARIDKVTPKAGKTLQETEEAKPETPPDPEEVKKVIQRLIKQKGLVNKGHMGIPGMPDENLTMFEHPDHPGLTATLRDREITNADTLTQKMNSKLKEFGVKNPRDTASHIVQEDHEVSVPPPSTTQVPMKDLFSKDESKAVAAAGRLGELIKKAEFGGKVVGDISQTAAIVNSVIKGVKHHSQSKQQRAQQDMEKMVDSSTRG